MNIYTCTAVGKTFINKFFSNSIRVHVDRKSLTKFRSKFQSTNQMQNSKQLLLVGRGFKSPCHVSDWGLNTNPQIQSLTCTYHPTTTPVKLLTVLFYKTFSISLDTSLVVLTQGLNGGVAFAVDGLKSFLKVQCREYLMV